MGESRRELAVPLRVEVHQLDGERRVEYAVNLSAGGACLHLEAPVPEGSTLSLHFELPPDGTSIEVTGQVVWCAGTARDAEGMRFYETGVRFSDIPRATEKELLIFASQNPERQR